MAIVGSPDYLRTRTVPASPAQLIDHRAINLRLPTSGTLNGWRLMRGGREARVRIEGPLIPNTIDLILDAALDGHGLAYLPLDQVQRHLDEGRLVRVLSNFTPDLPGYIFTIPTDAMPLRHSLFWWRRFDFGSEAKHGFGGTGVEPCCSISDWRDSPSGQQV